MFYFVEIYVEFQIYPLLNIEKLFFYCQYFSMLKDFQSIDVAADN